VKTAHVIEISQDDSLEESREIVLDAKVLARDGDTQNPIEVVVNIQSLPESRSESENEDDEEANEVERSENMELPTTTASNTVAPSDPSPMATSTAPTDQTANEVSLFLMNHHEKANGNWFQLLSPQGPSLKSRKISQLPVAPKDSPNAEKIGIFVKISRTDDDDQSIAKPTGVSAATLATLSIAEPKV
jgi:hypothetical protein